MRMPMLKLEARPQPSSFWSYGSPLLALVMTVLIGTIMFLALGKDPVRGLEMFFWQPIRSGYALGELMVKATPLLIIALGLAVCFRSNVWNIGAEGQYIIGAIFAAVVALMAGEGTGGWIVVPIVLAGIAGGMVWAAITAVLRDRFNANEILVSLMLVYIAVQLLSYVVSGPLKDESGPTGYETDADNGLVLYRTWLQNPNIPRFRLLRSKPRIPFSGLLFVGTGGGILLAGWMGSEPPTK